MTLNVAALRSRLDAAGIAETAALADESDPSLAAEGFLNFAYRQEQAGRLEAAAELYAEVAASGPEESLRRRAQARLTALQGGGPFGARFEVLSRQFVSQAADPAMLVGMGAAATVASFVRLGALSRLLASPTASVFTRGAGARLLASGAAFIPEVGAFWGASRLTRTALGGPDQAWDAASLTREWGSLALSLGLLKLGGWASRGAFDRLHGVDALAGGAARLPALTRYSRPLLENFGMFGGIALAHGLEARFGLAPARSGSWWSDSLATLLQFHVGGRLSRELLGPGHAARMQELALRTRGLEQSASPDAIELGPRYAFATGGTPTIPAPRAEPAKGLPTVMMAQSVEGGGGWTRAPAPKQGSNGSTELHDQLIVTRLAIETRIRSLDPDYFEPERLASLPSKLRKGIFNRSELARIQHAIRRYLNEANLPSYRLDAPEVRQALATLWRNPRPEGEPSSDRYRRALSEVEEAREVLSHLGFYDGSRFEASPFRYSPGLSQALGLDFYFLNDAGRGTGSFKERGALVEVRRVAREGALHVVTASHGNHGLAVSLAAQKLGLRSTIVVPDTTPQVKIQRLEGLGATVVTTGEEPWRGYEEARDWALRYTFQRNQMLERYLDLHGVLRYVHGFEDVIPGQGVAGFEILDAIRSLPERDRFADATFLIPTGGGGLAAGVATVLRHYLPGARVLAVASDEAPAMHFSLLEGRRSEVFLNEQGLCDSGIGLTIPGARPFELLRETLDGSLTVSDARVGEGMRLIHRHEGLVVEGSAAVGVAALLDKPLPEWALRPGAPVVTILTGGNIDAALHARVRSNSTTPRK